MCIFRILSIDKEISHISANKQNIEKMTVHLLPMKYQIYIYTTPIYSDEISNIYLYYANI